MIVINVFETFTPSRGCVGSKAFIRVWISIYEHTTHIYVYILREKNKIKRKPSSGCIYIEREKQNKNKTKFRSANLMPLWHLLLLYSTIISMSLSCTHEERKIFTYTPHIQIMHHAYPEVNFASRVI